MTEVSNYNVNRSLMGEENRQNLNKRMNREITESFANDIQIIKNIDESREKCYEECLKNIKDNYEEFYNKINNLYNEYYGIQNQNYIQIGENENRAIKLYKNFIRVMVLGLNKSDVRLLVETVYNNDLSFDSFYSYFKYDIEISSKKDENGNILEYDLNIENISDSDPRLKDHIYIYYEHFNLNAFKSFSWNFTTLLDINMNDKKNKMNIDIDLGNKKVELKYNNEDLNLNFNIYYFINLTLYELFNYNFLNQIYYDSIIFFKNFIINNKFRNIYYTELFFRINQYFGEYLETFGKSFILGERERFNQSFRKNTFFYKELVSSGKFNVISTYLLEIRNLGYYNVKNNNINIKNKLNDKVIYLFLSYMRLFLSIMKPNDAYLIEFSSIGTYIQHIFANNNRKVNFNFNINSENYNLIDQKVDKNKQEPYKFYKKYSKLIIDNLNLFNTFFDKYKNINIFTDEKIFNNNYIQILLNSRIKLIENTYYFNLAQYPLLFNIEDNQFSEIDALKREGKIKKSFYPLIDIIENPDKFKENNKKLVLCILNFYNSQLNSNSINQYLKNKNDNKNEINLLNSYSSLVINFENIDDKVNFIIQDIFYILRAKHSIFNICKFFYYFNKLIQLKISNKNLKNIIKFEFENYLFSPIENYSFLKTLNSSKSKISRINHYLEIIFSILKNSNLKIKNFKNVQVETLYNYMNKEIKNLEEKYKKLWIKKKELLKNINDMKKARNTIKTKEFTIQNSNGKIEKVIGLKGLLAKKKVLEDEYNNLVKIRKNKSNEKLSKKLKYDVRNMLNDIRDVKLDKKLTNKTNSNNLRRPLIANYNSNSNGGPREPINV